MTSDGKTEEQRFICTAQGLDSYRLEHPVLSSVLYLSGSTGRPSSAADKGGGGGGGGPTVVLDQTPEGGPAMRAWAVHPAEGRFLAFSGNLLHGVLPEVSPGAAASGGGAGETGGLEPAPTSALEGGSWRTTLIIAWWASGQGPEVEGCGAPSSGEMAVEGRLTFLNLLIISQRCLTYMITLVVQLTTDHTDPHCSNIDELQRPAIQTLGPA